MINFCQEKQKINKQKKIMIIKQRGLKKGEAEAKTILSSLASYLALKEAVLFKLSEKK